jgi:hypothetical protein
MGGSLHLTVPSMNRLNQTEPATFSMLPCWAFFGDSYFLYFALLIFIPVSFYVVDHYSLNAAFPLLILVIIF